MGTCASWLIHANSVYGKNQHNVVKLWSNLNEVIDFFQKMKRQRNQRSNYQHLLDHVKAKRMPKISSSASLAMLKLLTV